MSALNGREYGARYFLQAGAESGLTTEKLDLGLSSAVLHTDYISAIQLFLSNV